MQYYEVPCPINNGLKEMQFNITAGSLVLLCEMYFDDDSISATYNHWIMKIQNLSVEEEDIRFLTLYPNTTHFVDDTYFEFTVLCTMDNITFDNLFDVKFNIGVQEEALA